MGIKVGVLGAKGRMGQEVIRAVQAAEDLEFVAGLDLGDSLQALIDTKAEVIVDFTTPDSVMDNISFAIENGIHCVVGTTGFTTERLETLQTLIGQSPKVGVLVAPNFGLGAVLMMEFSKKAARYFESAEIIELHHPNKIDAPSGTSTFTAEAISRARRDAGLSPMPDATTTELAGARGAVVGEVHVHSVRLRGLLAHQEVIFGGPGETLSIRHDSLDRVGFMPGVLLGIRQVEAHPGITYGLEGFLSV